MRVVSVTPAGRKRYLEILVPYLLKNRAKISEHHFWVNTPVVTDIAYIKQLCYDYPDFFKYITNPNTDTLTNPLNLFHPLCTDENTIYIRFDDDICWIANDLVDNIIKFRIENPDYFLVFANIINNSVCAMLHQRCGVFDYPALTCDGVCNGNAWANTDLALFQHTELIHHIKEKTTDVYKCFKKWLLFDGPKVDEKIIPEGSFGKNFKHGRFSINCMCWFGRDYAKFGGKVYNEEYTHEEGWLTDFYPQSINKFNAICGDALVSHFAYFSQRAILETTDLLDQYKKLALQA